MASIFGHGLVAYTTTRLLDSKSNRLLLFLAIVSSIIPDLDVIAFSIGIPYEHPLGHRGFSHSILFALLWSVLLTLLLRQSRKWIVFLVLFLSTISHGVLDALTTGGRGVGFLIPYDNERYFFPMRVIKVSPIGIEEFFSEWGMRVILSELKYIAFPCAIILITLSLYKKTRA
ncbi:metal-dependent hydrolase [Psychroserpens sp.]|uniref:metal-dependent hydrolase n=1 Tax=Psychroserpens sp. TaxID=2020870 RepID=UPI001B1686A5|nr:metal-dependent hydrolase [Psychroserpens sp.]MBO6607949.1 metal-dependent hydrolase [Psychroserpens sp.]MBO6631040.1 metal-dependent hydrolase [Psychroserpens sp.]MBO6654924.1 metal-dependent hydrolase [Psychroserpens sp.]MBO6683002.1 metal-dependent hydrolase [Psychroserpens sp.]MBO6751307.1 metal-dependent hydrolase [Psychroserpens sp.]